MYTYSYSLYLWYVYAMIYTRYTKMIIIGILYFLCHLPSSVSLHRIATKMTIAITAPAAASTPFDLKLTERKAEEHLKTIYNGYSQSVSSLSFLMAVDGQVYRALLLGRQANHETSWSAVVTCRLLLETASLFQHDLQFPSYVFDGDLLCRFFNITQPMSNTSSFLVTWKCGRTDEDTLLELCNNVLAVIRSESNMDELSPYVLRKGFLKALFGLTSARKNSGKRCVPTFAQLRTRWHITLESYKERTNKVPSPPTVHDASMWKLREVSPMSENAAVERYISAEDCVGATSDVFKVAIEELLQKGYLDVQLGFTKTPIATTDSSSELTNSTPTVREVPLVTPSGEVLGYVWHVKGAISLAWQAAYWSRIDELAFANYPGTGERVIRIAAKHVNNVFLLGRQNNRVLESVALSTLEEEFL